MSAVSDTYCIFSNQFWSKGILAVNDFLTEDEVSSLRESCLELVGEMDPNEHRGVFSTTEHNQVKKIKFLMMVFHLSIPEPNSQFLPVEHSRS